MAHVVTSQKKKIEKKTADRVKLHGAVSKTTQWVGGVMTLCHMPASEISLLFLSTYPVIDGKKKI